MDFELEFKEFNGYVSSMQFQKQSELVTLVELTTLEGEIYHLRCTTYGITLLEKNEVYESMEQILMKYSPKYV
jgi:hypothetical protein